MIWNGHDTVNECSIVHNFQNGWTALMSASFNGHTTVVEVLLQHGASVDKQEEVSNGDTTCIYVMCCMVLYTTY